MSASNRLKFEFKFQRQISKPKNQIQERIQDGEGVLEEKQMIEKITENEGQAIQQEIDSIIRGSDHKYKKSVQEFDDLVNERVKEGPPAHQEYILTQLSIVHTAIPQEIQYIQLPHSLVECQLRQHFQIFCFHTNSILKSFLDLLMLYYRRQVVESPQYKMILKQDISQGIYQGDTQYRAKETLDLKKLVVSMERRFQLKLSQKLETFVQEYIQKEFISVVEKEFEEIVTGEGKNLVLEPEDMNSRQRRASRPRRSNVQIDSKTGKIHFEQQKTLRSLLNDQEIALNHTEMQEEQTGLEFDHHNIRELVLEKHKNKENVEIQNNKPVLNMETEKKRIEMREQIQERQEMFKKKSEVLERMRAYKNKLLEEKAQLMAD